ncbi:hypothetical protein Pst134EA_032767 [Puccinia striiformis f. sp. tritici]|uniref:uncharacterized protein n=1 Tax=Puccinia striiformis f. sp. tritici TaxID=168172 RepID=UPI0020089F3E|nr:uncharacterized protein Pst134EA_032767 [Puccinia striiformis f. sp. tritici]KAH9443537.1 hypothetical protein Pst134EA_032767 [Puccinia striiformis f. sp. tritici]
MNKNQQESSYLPLNNQNNNIKNMNNKKNLLGLLILSLISITFIYNWLYSNSTQSTVLKDNGTATDAAIATALCVGVVNSFSSGIGGGGFMIIKPASDDNEIPTTIDFRETVPNGEYYSQAFINDPTKSEKGGLSIGIPGELAGFEAAYQKFGGGVSWKRIFQPSIDLAKNFSVGTALASKLSNQDTIDWMNNRQEWRSIFLPTLHHQKVGQEEGDWIQRVNYARTLEIIADQGIKPFYEGDIAKQLVDTINREGGKVSMDDFRTYKNRL